MTWKNLACATFVVLGAMSARADGQEADPPERGVPAPAPATEQERDDARRNAIPLTALLAVGDEFAYRAESLVEQTVTTPAGVAMRSANESVAELSFKVISVGESGGADVEMRYERLRVSVRGSGAAAGGMEFDSEQSREDDAGNVLAMTLRPVVEAPVVLVLDAGMVVREVKGLEGLVPEGGKSMITKESIISTVTPLFALRTEPGSAEVGESWTSEGTEKQRGFTLVRTSRKTLEGVRGDEARLSLVDETRVESGAIGPGMELERWTTTGEAVWDVKARRLISIRAESEQVITGAQAGVPIRQAQAIKSTMTRIPLEFDE